MDPDPIDRGLALKVKNIFDNVMPFVTITLLQELFTAGFNVQIFRDSIFLSATVDHSKRKRKINMGCVTTNPKIAEFFKFQN